MGDSRSRIFFQTWQTKSLLALSWSLIWIIVCAEKALPRYVLPETKQVPVNRLLKNLSVQQYETGLSPNDKAMIDFRIGRLHSMAYALKTEVAPTEKNTAPGSRYEIPCFGSNPEHVQFKVVPAPDKSKAIAASAHLREAIVYLQKALKKDASLLPAQLGLAWCFDQSGDKNAALSLYRLVFQQAYNMEKDSRGGMLNWSIAVETAGYLKALLDKRADLKEIEDITNKVGKLQKIPRWITPILMPLNENLNLSELVDKKPRRFDLDGLGSRLYDGWPSKKAGWLVFDSSGQGQIKSGLELIGSVTFWLFWQNGYQVLASLDDNRDGKLSGSELIGLSIWCDKNGNAVSDKGEVRSLLESDVVSLSTSYGMGANGLLFNPNGVTLSSGKTLATYDLILHTKNRE